MKLLLDTHSWFWAAARPESLSQAAQAAISNASNELVLSPVSVWELLALARKGKLDLGKDPQHWVQTQIVGAPVGKLLQPLTVEIALRSEQLAGYENPDPADRFLVATALEHDLVLVTADRSMRDYRALRTIW